jgi:sugar porter (SP) family MFS transporter
VDARVAAIPGAVLAIGMLTVPHTPRWLVQQGRGGEAGHVLADLRNSDDRADPEAELDDIERAAAAERGPRVRDLFRPRMRRLLLVGVGLAAFQQFVGVNTVIYYAPTILSETGLTNSAAIAQTVFVGVTNVVFTVVAVLLLDRLGRRALLLTGTGGLTVALVALGVYFASGTLQEQAPYLALAALIVFIAAFAVGLGPVFWLMISEIYPVQVRSAAMSVSTVVNWACNFLVAAAFLTLSGAITPQGTFFLYAGLAVVAIVFFARRVPETKDRSLEEIQRELVGGGRTGR